jgi:hypothetical protein
MFLASVNRKAENWSEKKGSLRLEALEMSHENYSNPILYNPRARVMYLVQISRSESCFLSMLQRSLSLCILEQYSLVLM